MEDIVAFLKNQRRAHDLVLDTVRSFGALLTTIEHAGPDDLERIKREAAAYRKAVFDPDRRKD